jgi:hypothetical protein
MSLTNLTGLETLIKEIQIREKLKSPRQVFAKYPDLGDAYLREYYAARREPDDSKKEIQSDEGDNIIPGVATPSTQSKQLDDD